MFCSLQVENLRLMEVRTIVLSIFSTSGEAGGGLACMVPSVVVVRCVCKWGEQVRAWIVLSVWRWQHGSDR